jgi:hypothetical protein
MHKNQLDIKGTRREGVLSPPQSPYSPRFTRPIVSLLQAGEQVHQHHQVLILLHVCARTMKIMDQSIEELARACPMKPCKRWIDDWGLAWCIYDWFSSTLVREKFKAAAPRTRFLSKQICCCQDLLRPIHCFTWTSEPTSVLGETLGREILHVGRRTSLFFFFSVYLKVTCETCIFFSRSFKSQPFLPIVKLCWIIAIGCLLF